MARFFEWLSGRLRPFHNDQLPEDLQFPSNPHWYFTKGAMLRSAALSVSQNMQFGVFRILGPDLAKRATRVWRPREFLLMEDVSLAFFEVENRAYKRVFVAPVHVDRLVHVLSRYLEFVHKPLPESEIKAKVMNAIEEMREMEDMPEEDGEG